MGKCKAVLDFETVNKIEVKKSKKKAKGATKK